MLHNSHDDQPAESLLQRAEIRRGEAARRQRLELVPVEIDQVGGHAADGGAERTEREGVRREGVDIDWPYDEPLAGGAWAEASDSRGGEDCAHARVVWSG